MLTSQSVLRNDVTSYCLARWVWDLFWVEFVFFFIFLAPGVQCQEYDYLISYTRAQNTCRHTALCRAAAVICREALKMCGKCAARLAGMPWLSKSFELGGKSPFQTDNKPQYLFSLLHAWCFLCHQSSRANHRFPNCMSWSLDGSEDVCRHLVIKTCTASKCLARHGNCAALQTRTHAEKRKKT